MNAAGFNIRAVATVEAAVERMQESLTSPSQAAVVMISQEWERPIDVRAPYTRRRRSRT